MERYICTCVCGRENELHRDCVRFACPGCGRRSIVDFTAGYSERELVEMLGDLDVKRDRVAEAIEIRRQRRAS